MNESIIFQEEMIDTDVLVVGAGVGGMMAAISAADLGSRVVLCEKGNARRSGGIRGGNDHFNCYIPEIHGPALKETFIRENLGWADENIVRIQIERSYEALQKWESWGVNMKINGHYEFTGHSWPGSSGKMGEPGKTNRSWLHFWDENLSVKLEKQVRDRNVRIINRIMVTELLKDANGRVVGAVGVSTREPKLYIIQAKSIVLNKSMGARIRPPADVIGYSLADTATGDQSIMVYRSGGDIVAGGAGRRQSYNRFGPRNGRGTWIGVLRDNEGKPVAPPYLDKPNAETGERAVENGEAVDHVWSMGNGPVWMDPRGISEEDEQYMRNGLRSEGNLPFLRWVDQEQINIKKTRFEFSIGKPGVGGISVRTDAKLKTTIDGLFAISQGPLSMSAVGGMVAGENAVEDANKAASPGLSEHLGKISKLKEHYERLLNGGGTQFADWREVQWAIYQIMDCYVQPPLMTENTLMTGYRQLLRIREKANRILRASNQHDLYHCLEVINSLDIAELVILATIERKESRGGIRRLDYPFVNPMFDNKMLVISQKDNRPNFRWEERR